MKRKENIIDKISLQMMNDEISDEAIIALISENVGDLEMGDRQGRTLLIDAAFYKRQKVIEWLLAHGANINAQDENGFSALHAATQEKNIKMVSFLLQNGAHVNIQDAFGNTPISRTNLATPIGLFRMLLEAGANPNIKIIMEYLAWIYMQLIRTSWNYSMNINKKHVQQYCQQSCVKSFDD